MTDQIFYEELRATIRDAIASYLDTYTDEELRELATESLNLPPRPTLADMTEEERRACQWMQADVENRSVRYVIATPHDAEGDATLVDPYGEIEWMSPERVTPRPDLPRMEWPAGDEEAEDANTVKVGDVIESADDPRIDALPVGSILLDCDGETAIKRSEAWTGDGYTPIEDEGDELGPWTVLHIPKEADQ